MDIANSKHMIKYNITFKGLAYLWNNQDVREDNGSIEWKTSQRLAVKKRKT